MFFFYGKKYCSYGVADDVMLCDIPINASVLSRFRSTIAKDMGRLPCCC